MKLANNGKAVVQIEKEYGISRTTIYTWIRKHEKTGSFRNKDNRSATENEINQLRKENKQLRMEVDLLKQAALIMARK